MGNVSSMLPNSLLCPKESFTSNFKTKRIFLLKKDFFNRTTFNRFLRVTYSNLIS